MAVFNHGWRCQVRRLNHASIAFCMAVHLLPCRSSLKGSIVGACLVWRTMWTLDFVFEVTSLLCFLLCCCVVVLLLFKHKRTHCSCCWADGFPRRYQMWAVDCPEAGHHKILMHNGMWTVHRKVWELRRAEPTPLASAVAARHSSSCTAAAAAAQQQHSSGVIDSSSSCTAVARQ